MLQGDSYPLKFTLKDSAGTLITNEMVSDVEIIVGDLRKTYAKNELTYFDGKWIFALTQEQTINAPKRCNAQVRVKFINNSEVIGKITTPLFVETGYSKVVL
jgi:hypothetical protein